MGEVDYQMLLSSIVAPIIVALLSQIASLISLRRADRGWDGIIKAIEVYGLWADRCSDETVARLRVFIDREIDRIVKPLSESLVISLALVFLFCDGAVFFWGLKHRIWLSVCSAGLSFVSITYQLVQVHLLKKESAIAKKDQNKRHKELVDDIASILGMIQIKGDMIGFIEHLEEEKEIGVRLAELFAEGDPYVRKLILQAISRAREGRAPDTNGI